MNICKGQKYRHFKGGIYEVITLARHTETKEELVIYTDGKKVCARPTSMFLSKVDYEKYPNVDQEYRFELIDNDCKN